MPILGLLIDAGELTAITPPADSTKTWVVNEHVGRYLYYPDSGATYAITANTATELTIPGVLVGNIGGMYEIRLAGTDAPVLTESLAKNSYPVADSAKVAQITVTQPVDLDAMESGLTSHLADVANPHNVTAAQIGAVKQDANGELVQLPAGAAAEVAAGRAASVKRADGTWHRPGTHDYLTLSANYYPTAAATWLNVINWTALQLSNFTYAAGVFTCAKAGRYRIRFNPEPNNGTNSILSIISRLNFSSVGALSLSYYTFTTAVGAYGAVSPSESIVDFAVGDTFSPQYYVSININGTCYLQVYTALIIEEL